MAVTIKLYSASGNYNYNDVTITFHSWTGGTQVIATNVAESSLTIANIKSRTSIGIIEGFFRRKGAEFFITYHDL